MFNNHKKQSNKWKDFIKKSRNLLYIHILYIAKPPNRQLNIYRIDAYIWEECAEKKLVVCFN